MNKSAIGLMIVLVFCNIASKVFADSGTVLACTSGGCDAIIVSTSGTTGQDLSPSSTVIFSNTNNGWGW